MNRSPLVWKYCATLFLLLLTTSLGSAQDSSEAQDFQPILDALPITVDPNAYSRDCLPFYHLSPLGNYIDMLEAPRIQLDENGVMMLFYGPSYDNPGWQYSITQLAFFGMSALESWCQNGDLLALQLAVNQAEWLIDNAVHIGDFATWHYHFPNPNYLLLPPWSSGLSNGIAIYLFTQLHAIHADQKYMDISQLAVKSFAADMKDGGVRYTYDDGSVVFEETARPDAPFAFILNGHMISVEALAYYADYSHDETAAELVREGIATLRAKLPDFDASTIAAYSLGPINWGSARIHYAHSIHVRALFWLYERTDDPFFLRYTFDWQHYKWPAIPSDIYLNAFTPDTHMAANPDTLRWLVEPLDTQAFVVDLREVRPLRSFGYSMNGPYPTEITISISDDAENWTELKSETHYTKSHGMFDLGDQQARFVRLGIGNIVNDMPLYYQIREGIYSDKILIGATRVDDASYWEDPILLLTQGVSMLDEVQVLRDSNDTTTLPLLSDAVIYVDLREAKAASALNITGTGSASRTVWFEASDDMQNWTPIGEAQTVTLPGSVAFPQTDTPHQFWRIHFDGDEPLIMDTALVQ